MRIPTHMPPKSVSPPRRVLVLGASASFGPDLVRGFAAQNARVFATTRSGNRAEFAPAVQVAALDLLNAESVDRFVRDELPPFGKLDVAVFLAGVLPGKALADYDDALMQRVMDTNFTGQAALLRRLLPHFAAGAQIWLLSSISGDRGSFDPVYAASKAALVGFVKSLAIWLAPGLRVNALAPGVIEDSAMFEAMAPERRDHHVSATPTGRLTTPAEVAAVIVNLCEPAWANLNGQVIRLNGGAHV